MSISKAQNVATTQVLITASNTERNKTVLANKQNPTLLLVGFFIQSHFASNSDTNHTK